MDEEEQNFLKPTMLSFISAQKNSITYERYGLREFKDLLSFDEFCDLVDHFYSYTNSSKNSRSFFRHQECQTRYRKINKLNKNQDADHIISTAVFREIIRFSKDTPKLTFDYWASIKSTLNQCWNFQTLSKNENSTKASIEFKICNLLKEAKIKELKNDKNCMKYITNIHSVFENALKKGKTFFNQAKKIAETLNYFFQELDLKKLNFLYEISHISCITKENKELCELCSYCKDSSLRWRLKYSVLYQNNNRNLTRDILHQKSLDIFFDGLYKSEVEKKKNTLGLTATTIWALFLEVRFKKYEYSIIYSKFWKLSRDYCLKKANKMNKKNLKVFFRNNTEFPEEITHYINIFLQSGGKKKDFIDNLKNATSPHLIKPNILWGGKDKNTWFKRWTEDLNTYTMYYSQKKIIISSIDIETGEENKKEIHLSQKEIEDHFSERMKLREE